MVIVNTLALLFGAIFLGCCMLLAAFIGSLLYMVVLNHRLRARALEREEELLSTPLPPDTELPHVVVQIPSFNEGPVLRRGVEAAAALEEFFAGQKGRTPSPPGKFVQEKANLRLDLAASAEGRYDDVFSYKGDGSAVLLILVFVVLSVIAPQLIERRVDPLDRKRATLDENNRSVIERRAEGRRVDGRRRDLDVARQ